MNPIDRSKRIEATVAQFLSQKVASRTRVEFAPPREFSSYDFILYTPKADLRCELKSDFASKKTENVFFETWNCYRDEPSGLTTTRADRWIHHIPHSGELFIFEPSPLFAWLCKKDPSSKLWKTGAGDNNSDGVIVPVRTVREINETWFSKYADPSLIFFEEDTP